MWFSTWMKDTLATGLDATYGAFPDNVYIFDYFRKIADGTGHAPIQYVDGSGDDHPSALASELIAPQFVEETFDAAIAYESIVPVEVDFNPISTYTLEQNYPNPFNPSTTIKYSIPEDGFVKLAVYNLLGEEVISLVNNEQKAGRYEVVFDASRFASGVYMYRLESKNFLSIKKMLLVK